MEVSLPPAGKHSKAYINYESSAIGSGLLLTRSYF